MHIRNRILLVIACACTAVLTATGTSEAQGRGDAMATESTELECGFCETNTPGGPITHDWVPLACCDLNSAGCFEYPDAQQYGNGGSCPGMHRPCTSTE